MCKPDFRIVPPLLILLLLPLFPFNQAAAQEDIPQEIGGSANASDEDPDPGNLSNLETLLDLSANYTHFTGEDMDQTYGGIPQVSLGLTFRFSRFWWFHLSGGYGETSGDPYHGTSGIITQDQVEVRYIPFLLGIKYNMARSSKVRVYVGFGLEFAWTEETVPLQDETGAVVPTSSSGLNNGYFWNFGPEFILGQGGQALGLEVGWGGSKGAITSEGHSHDIDMTGFRGRIYFAIPL